MINTSVLDCHLTQKSHQVKGNPVFPTGGVYLKTVLTYHFFILVLILSKPRPTQTVD